MSFPIEAFATFVANAPLADPLGSSDLLAVLQGGLIKRLPVNSIPLLATDPVTIVTTAGYAVLLTDKAILVDQAAPTATTITLPSNPGRGRVYTIADIAGNAAAGNITIANGTIDGGGGLVLNTNYASVTLISTGTANDWKIIARI